MVRVYGKGFVRVYGKGFVTPHACGYVYACSCLYARGLVTAASANELDSFRRGLCMSRMRPLYHLKKSLAQNVHSGWHAPSAFTFMVLLHGSIEAKQFYHIVE